MAFHPTSHRSRGSVEQNNLYMIVFDIENLLPMSEMNIRIVDGQSSWSADGPAGCRLSGDVQISYVSISSLSIDAVAGTQPASFRLVVFVATSAGNVVVESIFPSGMSARYLSPASDGVLPPGRFVIPLQ